MLGALKTVATIPSFVFFAALKSQRKSIITLFSVVQTTAIVSTANCAVGRERRVKTMSQIQRSVITWHCFISKQNYDMRGNLSRIFGNRFMKILHVHAPCCRSQYIGKQTLTSAISHSADFIVWVTSKPSKPRRYLPSTSENKPSQMRFRILLTL